MCTIRRITTAALAMLCLATASLWAAAAAIAVPIEPPAGGPGLPQPPVVPQVPPTSTIVTNGSPWWTFVVVAAVTAAVTAATALAVLWLRRSRRPRIATV